jgi:hypothetical protein
MMGKARSGTEKLRRRTVQLTDHALERVRDRLDLSGVRDHSSETDDSIGNRIDGAVVYCRRNGLSRRYTEIVDGEPRDVEVCCGSEFLWDADLWAVVRGNRVITVLTGDQVVRSVVGEKWKTV